MMYCSRCKQPLTKSMFACGCGTVIPGRKPQPAMQPAAAQPLEKPQTASARKIPCAGCGYEVDENNMPSDWKNIDGKHYCPYCYPKVQNQNTASAQSSQPTATSQTAQPVQSDSRKVFGVNEREKLAQQRGMESKFIQDWVIPEGYTVIGSETFRYFQLKSITLPSSLKEIETSAFCDCKNLESINIPDSVSIIGDYAFYNISYATAIMESSTPPKIAYFSFEKNSALEENGIKVIVPRGSLSAYKNAPYWKDISDICEA